LTDAASGNIPDINSVEDAFGYVANSAMNALDVAGAGKIAKAGLNGLGKLGLNYLPDVAGNMATNAAADLADPMMIEWLSGWEKYADGVTIVGKRSYLGQFSTASLLKTGASAALGVHGNSVNSPKPTMVYEHTFQSGKTYTGVGDVNGDRAAQSAKKWGANDPLVSTKTTTAPNRKTAYQVEQILINENRRLNGASSVYNKKNTGRNLLKSLNKIF
jgi:hypothetical protein